MVLLDTCAVIWLANKAPMSKAATDAIELASLQGQTLISVASAWEIGLLTRPRGERPPGLQLFPDPHTWFRDILDGPGIRLATLTPQIAIDASHLPGKFHADPADRLVTATARSLGASIITRDRKILAYAEAGFVEAIAC